MSHDLMTKLIISRTCENAEECVLQWVWHGYEYQYESTVVYWSNQN